MKKTKSKTTGWRFFVYYFEGTYQKIISEGARRPTLKRAGLLISQEPTFWPCEAKESLIERCRNRGKTTSVESCNRHTYTKHSHPLTHTQTIVEHLHQERKLKHKTRTNNVLFSILVYCPSWRKARRRRRRDGAADRRVKKENTEKIVIL